MNNKISNKQIPLESIINIADKLEFYKEKYEKLFLAETVRNKNLLPEEQNFEYKNAFVTTKYIINLHTGIDLTESNYNSFVQNLNDPKIIKGLSLYLSISYMGKSEPNSTNDKLNKIVVFLNFQDIGITHGYSEATIDIDVVNCENEARNIYSEIMNIIDCNDDRYNKTIKHRKLRIQSFCISIGIILSYLLYFIFKMNIDKLPVDLVQNFNNKYYLLVFQWMFAILSGNILSYWFMFSLYKPLLPISKYVGFNTSTYKSVYKDDITNYLSHCEVHIGKYWDASKRRNIIEKIYKITGKIVPLQLIITIILFFTLK